jgi:hypothetical protein
MVNVSLTNSPEKGALDYERLVRMARFALGETVTDEKGRIAIVRAAFLAKEGQQSYAIELNGAISFIEGTKLKNAPAVDLAA